ncbi:MAG: hypothetical protein RIR70_1273, partial [Pseudomonadota bacterium]
MKTRASSPIPFEPAYFDPAQHAELRSQPGTSSSSAGSGHLGVRKSIDYLRRLSASQLVPRFAKTGSFASHVQHLVDCCLIDLEHSGMSAVLSTNEGASGACSHQAEEMMDASGARYRVKSNKYGAKATSEEVLAASVLRLIGIPKSPEVKFMPVPDEQGGYSLKIASKRIEGFSDWGTFLLDHGKRFVDGSLREDYQRALDHFARCEEKAERILADNPRLDQELKHPKRSIEDLGLAEDVVLADALREYQAARKAQNVARDDMLNLLPGAFSQALLRAFYAAEVVGNWDFANHDRANTGWVVGALHGPGELPERLDAVSVDFGNSGMNGFKGKEKVASKQEMLVPARFDDPYFPTHA